MQFRRTGMFDRVCEERIFYTSIECTKNWDYKAAYERCEKRVGIKRKNIRVWLKYAAMLVLLHRDNFRATKK